MKKKKEKKRWDLFFVEETSANTEKKSYDVLMMKWWIINSNQDLDRRKCYKMVRVYNRNPWENVLDTVVFVKENLNIEDIF